MTRIPRIPRVLAITATAAALVAALLPSGPAGAEGSKPTYGKDACTSSESWTFSGSIFESKLGEFESSLKGKIAPVRGFSEALAMRRFAQNNEMKWLGEYW